MAISSALSDSLRTRAVGYQILNKSFGTTTSNLPMRIAVFGEPNTANEATLDTTPFAPVNAKEVGDKYGYGSPLYQMARILMPIYGGGIENLPVIIYPQEFASGATATSIVLGVVVATSVTKTTTHTIKINGRDNIDGKRFDFTVTEGGNLASVVSAIADCINNVLAAPCTAVGGTGIVTVTSKWKGLSSAQLDIEFITNGDSAGIVYSESSRTDGTTTPSITSSLTSFGNEWNTLVLNPYSVATILNELETTNGTPSSATGKFTTTVFKPYIALWGSVEDDKDDIVAITNTTARKSQVTNVLCPAPLSKGFDFEAAANGMVLFAKVANNTPELGVGGKSYPDMPIPSDGLIGDMADISSRNFLCQRGSSTVLLENSKYTIQDFVTTYAPDGEVNPKFSYARDLIVDFNIGYRWKIIMLRDIQDKVIVSDTSPNQSDNKISPKQIKALLAGMLKQLEADGFITDSQFSIDSIQVGINQTNPSRLDIAFKYKRTSIANQISTDAAVDFSYNV